ncbi:hypothetical protein [Escherichia coli]|uniref:hypothetical protein n=2 Tax=Escherichia coli TaxID=562 RepID=UPI003855F23E
MSKSGNYTNLCTGSNKAAHCHSPVLQRHRPVCCPYCGSVDPFGYYRNTDRIVTILLALIIVVLLTTVSVSVCILCSW